MKDKVIFKEEIPITIHNFNVYDRTFIIETWFRRIVFAALMIKRGNQWTGIFSEKEKKKYYDNLDKYMDNPIMACSESNNMLWFTTINELREEIMKNEDIKEIIMEFTNMDPDIIISNLGTLKDIRNHMAHNRVITMDTLHKFNQLVESLFVVIRDFKYWFLYENSSEKIYHDDVARYTSELKKMMPDTYSKLLDDKDYDNRVIMHFGELMANNDWSYFQAFIAERKYFYSLTQLPCKLPPGYDDGDYLNLKVLTEKYSPVINNIMGFFINKMGSEYSVYWPKHNSIDIDIQTQIVDIFFNNKFDIWTDIKYQQQDERYVCNPLIWFYENVSPNDMK